MKGPKPDRLKLVQAINGYETKIAELKQKRHGAAAKGSWPSTMAKLDAQIDYAQGQCDACVLLLAELDKEEASHG